MVGAGRRHKNETAIVRAAAELGHQVRLVDVVTWTQNLGALALPLLERRIAGFAPEALVLTRHAIRLGEERLRRLFRGRYSAFWYFDLRNPPLPDVVRLGRLADAMFTTCLPEIETYRAAGVARVLYLPQGMDPEVDRPATRVAERYRCDVAFIGNGHHRHRVAVLRAVAAASRLQIRGPGWEWAAGELPVAGGPIYGEAYAEAVAGAAISLGANAMPEMAALTGSVSNRMWKVMGCGGFYLGEWAPGMDAFARDGEHCAWYRTPDEAVDRVRRYLGDPDARSRIAHAGRRHALAHHTYAHRVRLLLEGKGYEVG
ncbi:MAG TPA: glycosyltransferase [Gemmatimonadales bacterium]|nr:glycosyltransferase [Gemmatimonadales bacterium]